MRWDEGNQSVTFESVGRDTIIIWVGANYLHQVSPSGEILVVPFVYASAGVLSVGGRVYLYARQLAVALDMQFEERTLPPVPPGTRVHRRLYFEDR